MTEWHKLITIDTSWTSKQLEHHFKEVNGKLNIKLYTVKVSGTQILPDALAETLHEMLPDYIYSKTKISEIGEKKAALTVNHFFGKRNPNAEGKYGELLLFALVESVLGCKMVAHKIRTLSNFSDQMKGGDGVFIGNYTIFDGRSEPAYLIGESKVTQQYSTALDEALKSVKRFSDDLNSTQFRNTELIVAKENLILDDDMDVDELYNRLTPTTDSYKSQIIVHPILLMYDDSSIVNSEKNYSATRNDLEAKIRDEFSSRKAKIIESINKRLEVYPEIKNVYLDFFLIPYNDVDKFRNAMYYFIHGIPFQKTQ